MTDDSPTVPLRGWLAGNPSGLYVSELQYSYYEFMRQHALISPDDVQVPSPTPPLPLPSSSHLSVL